MKARCPQCSSCRQVCQEDIQDTCGRQLASLDKTNNDDGRVIRCLQDFKDELKVRATAPF